MKLPPEEPEHEPPEQGVPEGRALEPDQVSGQEHASTQEHDSTQDHASTQEHDSTQEGASAESASEPAASEGGELDPRPRIYFTPLHAALWMLGSLIAMVLLVGIFAAGSPDLLEDQVTVGALSALGFLLVSAWLLVKYPGGANLRTALGARPVDTGLLPLAAALGFCAQAPADALRRWVDEWAMKNGGGESGIVLESSSLPESIALLLVLAALVPFAEEAFFRGAVFGALRRSRVTSGAAAFITGLGFTLAHANLQLFLPIALVAAIFGFLRAVTGSLYPSLAAHMAFNAVPVAAVTFPAWKLDSFGEAHVAELSVAVPLLLFAIHSIASRSEWSRSGREAEAEPMFVEVQGAE